MEWLCQPASLLPNEITELLQLCASNKKIEDFADKNHTDPIALKNILIHFIDSVLLNKANSNYKLLGINDNTDTTDLKNGLHKIHYQLLIKIYHPDKNASANAADQAARITKAFQELKGESAESEFKNIQISRVPPNSFYTATTKAEEQLSNAKTASLAFLTIAIISAVWIGGYIYNPSNPELYSKNSNNKLEEVTNQQVGISKQQDTKDTKQKHAVQKHAVQKSHPIQAPTIAPLPLKSSTVANINLEPELFQNMLTNIEVAYEEGNATQIQGILNTPEIKQQPDNEVFAKLENLFQITSDRKMLLYNFEWKNISGQITGKGKFLSRYYLNGDNQWLTREGVASILAGQQPDNTFTITSLKLDNNNIDQ